MDWGRAVHYHMGRTLPYGSHSSTCIGRTHYYHFGFTLPRGWHTHYHLGSHTSTLVSHYLMGHTLSPHGSHAQFARRRNLLSGSRISHHAPNYLGADKLQKYNCTVSQTNMVIATLLSQRRNILESKHCPNLFDRLSVSVQILSLGAKPGRCQQICTVLASSYLSSCLMQHNTKLTNAN